MKILHQITKWFVVLLVFPVAAGCITPPSLTLPTPTSTAKPTVLTLPSTSNTLIEPTTEPTPLFTPIPTLLPNQEQEMAVLLQNENCTLPCYLGIVPGITSMSQAQSILKSLGASFRDEINKSDGTKEYIYDLDIGDPLVPKTTPGSSALVYQSLYLRKDENEDVITSIHVGIGTENTKETLEIYQNYWKRFSAKQIFMQLGQPDQLYTASKQRGRGIRSALIMVYEQIGVYIDLQGTGHETSICRDNESQQVSLVMNIFDHSSALNPDKLNPYLNDITVWVPIKDALGIDTGEFYRLVVTYPSICFWY